jgi:hypothetical protein
MYFKPDGNSAIVVDEALRRLDFRDPGSMKQQYSIFTPTCHGINHADFFPAHTRFSPASSRTA